MCRSDVTRPATKTLPQASLSTCSSLPLHTRPHVLCLNGQEMGKTKKEKTSVEEEDAGETTLPLESVPPKLNQISDPLAPKKLSKKLYKCVKKAAVGKNIRRGVKEVQKFINKGERGVVVMAGDILPIEVYCHLPVMCEDRNIPYVYVPSKADLGSSAGSKRPTCVILIKPHADYQDVYDECVEQVTALPKPL